MTRSSVSPKTHDELVAEELSRLSEAHACQAQAAIDAVAVRLFGLDEATVAEWRRLPAAEPLMPERQKKNKDTTKQSKKKEDQEGKRRWRNRKNNERTCC